MDNTNNRLESLDALRGFDMFWIMGGAGIFTGLSKLTGWGVLETWDKQLSHVPWDGFAFYDMIFPLFLFMAGISFPFSIQKFYSKGGTKTNQYKKIIKRGLLLVLLGFIYNGILKFEFENFRYASVLGRIGLAWMFAALIFINTKTISRVIWCFGLLISYWLVTVFISAPDYPDAGRFTAEGNIACYIDRILLPGKLYGKIFDPEGLLGIVPAISTALLGMLTGEFVSVKKESLTGMKMVGYMTIAGAALAIIGQIWNIFYPFNKALWSSSFVCFAGGLSILLFALFYLVVDVWGYRRPLFFFKVIGMNSITIYLAVRIIGFAQISKFFFGGIISLFPETWSGFLNPVANVAIAWLFLYFLYKQKIFLKV